nr:RteC domain-containing protein [Flavobacterium notoginsengisoli]
MEEKINLIVSKLRDVRSIVLKNGFKDINEEIYFFKHIKPQFVAKLIYYNSIYRISVNLPLNNLKKQKKYINKEIFYIRRFLTENLSFYGYFRNNEVKFDHEYFVRKEYSIDFPVEMYHLHIDNEFTTPLDYKLAKIISNDLLLVFLENKLKELNYISKSPEGLQNQKSKLVWSSSKSALIELIYALHANGSFDNKKIDLKTIVNETENIFGLSLGDFYHTFIEIKHRKINKTKFLDEIRESLLKKIESEEDRKF